MALSATRLALATTLLLGTSSSRKAAYHMETYRGIIVISATLVLTTLAGAFLPVDIFKRG